MFNRTLSNLYGTDPNGLSGLHGHGNTIGANTADGVSLFVGNLYITLLVLSYTILRHYMVKKRRFYNF